jgi:hypothetical protein
LAQCPPVMHIWRRLKAFADRERLTVDLDGHDNGCPFEAELNFHRARVREGVKTAIRTDDYSGDRQQATLRDTRELVLEVARDDVAEFSHRVPDLRLWRSGLAFWKSFVPQSGHCTGR